MYRNNITHYSSKVITAVLQIATSLLGSGTCMHILKLWNNCQCKGVDPHHPQLSLKSEYLPTHDPDLTPLPDKWVAKLHNRLANIVLIHWVKFFPCYRVFPTLLYHQIQAYSLSHLVHHTNATKQTMATVKQSSLLVF